jgi:hypothetical protein
MSFEPPEGILDIGNATLRVGKLEVAETSGLNQGLQNIIKNDLLITENTEYAVNHKWGIKLPTTWVAEFEVKGQSGKYIDFNFYNENSASNALGYNLTFKDTTMTLRYDGGNPLGGGAATIPTIVGAFRKVNIFFERGVISVSIDGTRYLYHKETDGFNQGLGVASRVVSTTGSAFVNLFIESDNENNSAFKNLRIVNGRFISDKTSNIAFIGGNLGVGVNSPKEALDIRGNMHFERVSNVSQIKVSSNVVAEYTGPHDRPLRKYPEVALTSASQGGYVVTQSNEDTVNSYFAYKAFNEIKGAPAAGTDIWYSGGLSHYNTSDGSAVLSGSDIAPRLDTNTDYGEWIGLELPKPIKLDSFKLWRQFNFQNHHPVSATLYAKKTSSDSWTEIYRYDDIDVRQGDTPGQFNVNSQIFYKFFAFVGRKRSQGVASVDGIGLAELEYYGHEEGSGSLDTTLKSVYNVPATTGTQLEVYYDGRETSSYSGSGTTVNDLAGTQQNGTLNGGVGFDTTYKAFTFDGSGDYIRTSTLPSVFENDPNLTQSVWVYFNELSFTRSSGSDFNSVLVINASGQYNIGTINELGVGPDGIVYHSSGARGIKTSNPIVSDNWYHITVTKTPGNTGNETQKIYINGVLVPQVPWNASGTQVIGANPFLTIGGSGQSPPDQHVKGSIANFRLYSKALNADQVKELYDYQKDYFLGSKSQVTLYKGHLGVGVTEPSGQLELAGDERIQEYPPGPMTGYETMIPGHGVFCASASSYYSSSLKPFNAFNKITTSGTSPWISDGNPDTFDEITGLASTANSFEGTSGPWIKLELPYNVKPKKVQMFMRTTSESTSARRPKSGIVYGRKDGVYHQITNFDFGSTDKDIPLEELNLNTRDFYSEFVLQITSMYLTGTSIDAIAIKGINYFGTPGPTTLDKGSLTLGRSLDVPRISRYDVDTETPRPEKLLVDFDTTVESFDDAGAADISGRGNHGVFYGDAKYSAPDKAFKFDGTDDVLHVNGVTGLPTGDAIYTLSCWVNVGATQTTTNPSVFYFGSSWATSQLAGIYFRDGNKVAHDIGSTNVYTTNPTLIAGKWHHIVVVKRGTGNIVANTAYQGIFVDGVEITQLSINGSSRSQTLGSSQQISVGHHFSGTIGSGGSDGFVGLVSNPKIYSVVLEPSEIKKLYNLGRTGRSMVISDTAVGIGKVPEAQLDVRGRTYSTRMEAQSMLVRSRNNRTWTAASQPWDGGGLTIAREEYPLDTTGARYWQIDMYGNYNLHISSNGRYTAYIQQNAGDRSLNFTGQHRCFIKDVPFTRANELEGLIVSSDQNKYIKMSNGIEAGSNAITTNESLPIVSLSKTHWDKKCFGVISASEDPENRTEQYGAFGSFFEKEEGDTRVYINSVGEGAIWVANTNGSLEAGDYISTSDISGYGQRQGSDYLKNYTVAKITMDCDFNPVSQPIEIIKKDEDGKNVLDAHGQIQWENHTTETEKAYKIRYLDASGAQTDESNAVHIAAFVGCTYHCG